MVLGLDVTKDREKVLRGIGSLIEAPVFYEHLSAAENLNMHLEYMDTKGFGAETALDMVGLTGTGKKPVGKFSLGMRQRLGIARAFIHKPQILILDEPINGLDPMGIRDMRNLFLSLIQKHGMTILLSSHILSEIEHTADMVGVIVNGTVVHELDLLIECGKTLYAHKGWDFDKEAERICKERALDEISPAENLEIAMKFADIIDDLHMLVITYNTHRELVSSDVPVIAINPFHKYTIGYGCMGLVLFFPISKQKVVVLYDEKMYPRFRETTYIELNNENEVCNLNIMQYVSAEKILFAYDSNHFPDIDSEARTARKNCREASPISTLGPEGNKILMTSMRQTLYDCELSFAQISHKFKRIPFTCREAAPRKWEKGWEEKFKNKEQIMPLIMSERPSILSRSGLTMKELRRGCRRMTDAAQIYWQTSTSIR